jgi:tRNA(Met) cytidine acetyltransferase
MKASVPENNFCQLWRDFRIISGEADSCRVQAMELLQGKEALWVGAVAPRGIHALSPRALSQWLGQDVEHLVFDAFQDFDADAFAIASGLVKGGGRFLLLTPALNAWGENGSHPRFYRRLAAICRSFPLSVQQPSLQQEPATGQTLPTAGQQQIIAGIERVAMGHPRRPLVVTADRGRGKSAALGMAAAKLLREEVKCILVTAPRLNATHALFRHASRLLPEGQAQRGRLDYADGWLQFMAPDEIVRQRPRADILLVDEAAAIPLPMLEKLLHKYRRVVFASTVHGYEGSGRGFSLRFSRLLDNCRPQWKSLQLRQPVRWAENDPLEKFTFDALLLDAEPAGNGGVLSIDALKVECLNRDVLPDNEDLLRQLFGLLIAAHYRTTPADLMHLLDAPNLDLWVGWLRGVPVAAMLVSAEGELPLELHADIMAGKRRPPGQLLPIAVATQCAVASALALRCERVVRIAVHPQLQHQGVGSEMLKVLVESAAARQVDFMGSSFGARSDLLGFWRRNGFSVVRLGYRKEASSGAHAVLVLRGISSAGNRLQQQSREFFVSQFPWQLKEIFNDLEPILVLGLMQESGADSKDELSDEKKAVLHAYAVGGRQYLDCLAALQHLARIQLKHPGSDASLFVLKLSQGRSWQDVAAELKLSGKKEAQKQLRLAVQAFLGT